jgi:hypothetical protein
MDVRISDPDNTFSSLTYVLAFYLFSSCILYINVFKLSQTLLYIKYLFQNFNKILATAVGVLFVGKLLHGVLPRLRVAHAGR